MSSNVCFMFCNPSLWAKGAYTYKVSLAIFSCFQSLRCSSVSMLCNLSASLRMRTLISLDIATTIFLIASAFASSFVLYLIRSNLVTPSTIFATSVPKESLIFSYVMSVSSIRSCNKAAVTVSISILKSDKYIATLNG